MTEETMPRHDDQPSQSALFSINDLFVIRSIIDVCSKRGAFQANELKIVGEIYERLSAFLKTIEDKANNDSSEQDSVPNTGDE